MVALSYDGHESLLVRSGTVGLSKPISTVRPVDFPARPVSLTSHQLDFHYHFPKSRVLDLTIKE